MDSFLMEELKNQIIDVFYKGNASNRFNSALLGHINKGKNLVHLSLVNELNALYQGSYPQNEQFYMIVNNMTNPPICKMCENFTSFLGNKHGYNKYCSNKCATSDKDRVDKINASKMEKYGENFQQIFEDKKKATNVERYGVEYPLQSNEIRNKTVVCQTERYGIGVGFQNKQTQTKAQATLLDRFNVKSGNAYVDPIIRALVTKEYLTQKHHVDELSLSAIAVQLDVSPKFIIHKMNEYNLDIKLFHTSSLEKIIQQYLIDNNIEYIANDRQTIQYELDILIPHHKLAIECDGMWYHSERYGYGNNKHLQKTLQCRDKNINLIHFFECDYQRLDLIFSTLSCRLGLNKKIGASKCKIKLIDHETTACFLNENHFQKHIPSKVNIGLFYNDELVQIMTFGKPRFSKQHEWELYRLCSLQNLTIMGGATKLLSHFIKTYAPNTIVSYSDKRLFQGNIYSVLGFVYSHTSAPNYWYFLNTKPNILMSRVQFQKHKLKDKLLIFDPNKSEWQNMIDNNYNRIWDCGNDVWIWTN